jgi:hypothetical protein
MKASEITVGQDYAYGTKGRWKTYRQARVLELGKHRVLEDSDAAVPAARIVFKDGTQQWVVLRSILMPWSEHVEAQARHNRAWEGQAQRNSENADRARNVIKELSELGLDTGTEPFELVGEQAISSGWVRVKIEFLEDVLDALS